jgi:hypothetical protein
MNIAKPAFVPESRKREPDWWQKPRSASHKSPFGTFRRKRLSEWTEILPDIPRERVLICRLEYTQTDPEKEFDHLAEEWREAVQFSSSVTEMCLHPAYQQIIGMGPVVVPLLLKELSQRPDHWFWALHAITKENPVDPEDAGDLLKMSEAWIEWGRARNCLK